MKRTEWPLYNRARLHGLSRSADDVCRPLHLDPGEYTPMNIQYAWDTYPISTTQEAAKERNKKLFGNSQIRAPFSNMWFEWQETTKQEHNLDGDRVVDCCALMVENPEDLDQFRMMLSWAHVHQRFAYKSDSIPVFFFGEMRYSDFIGEEFGLMEGFPIGVTAFGEDLAKQVGITPEKLAQEATESIVTVLWALLLLSCNNVTTVESQPFTRNNKRQKDPTRVVYRELHVEVPPGGKRSQSVSEGDEKAGTAFHVRRGHFADYTKGKGLFGKYHGKYWIPPTTVGDVEYGTVIKNYKLEGAH